MMNFDEFQKYFLTHVMEFMSPEEYGTSRVELHEVLKINGPKLHGVCLKKDNVSVAPIIYLEELYQELQKGDSVNEVLSRFASKYEKASKELIDRIDIDDIPPIDQKKNITYRLVNRHKNREILRTSPHLCVLDLAKIYYVRISDTKSVRVTHDMARNWGMSLEELDIAAMENSLMSPCLFVPKSSEFIEKDVFIAKDVPEHGGYFSGEPLNFDEVYCLSNEDMAFGAGTIIIPGVLKELGEKFNGDYYIIPSSLHEVMLIKKGGRLCAKDLQHILHDANQSVIKPADYLSDQVYTYQRETGRMFISTELMKHEKER